MGHCGRSNVSNLLPQEYMMKNMKQVIKEAAFGLGIETIGITGKTDYTYLEDFLLCRKEKNIDC